MIRSLFTSATGLSAQQTVLDNTANNLANVNTTGFKKNIVNFQDLVYITNQPAGAEASQGQTAPGSLQIGTGVRISGNSKVFTQGSLVNTGNGLNVAIEGNGFFQVTLPDGTTRYTRDGGFQLDPTGKIVNVNGFPILPSLTIPQNATVAIGTDGTVSATVPGNSTPTNVGQLQIANFPNPSGLSADGLNLLEVTAASGQPILGTAGTLGAGLLQGGFLEQSNVDVVGEMANLILAQRSYEFNLHSIKAADEMLQSTSQLVG